MPCAVLLLMLLLSPAAAGDTLRIAVASNFKPALQQINRPFETQSGHRILLSSASTGVLANQIIHGAPFDLFFAADWQTPQKLLQLKRHDNKISSPFCYAIGSLVLVGPGTDLQQLAQAQLSLAIANPATAPYGRAAQNVLARKQFITGQPRKLVRGNNATQAYQFWHSGAVDLALVPKALAPTKGIAVPQAWHERLVQHAIVLKPGPTVDAYLKWFESDTVRSLITQAGYQLCP